MKKKEALEKKQTFGNSAVFVEVVFLGILLKYLRSVLGEFFEERNHCTYFLMIFEEILLEASDKLQQEFFEQFSKKSLEEYLETIITGGNH